MVEARDIVASATVSASTVLTVATYRDGHAAAASIEMSPSGFAVVQPDTDGWVIHTNHFLDSGLVSAATPALRNRCRSSGTTTRTLCAAA